MSFEDYDFNPPLHSLLIGIDIFKNIFLLTGVTVKSVRVNIGPGGPNLLAFLVRWTKNASKLCPPPDPFC